MGGHQGKRNEREKRMMLIASLEQLDDMHFHERDFPMLVQGKWEPARFERTVESLDELRVAVKMGLEASPSGLHLFGTPQSLGQLLENLNHDTAMLSSLSVYARHP